MRAPVALLIASASLTLAPLLRADPPLGSGAATACIVGEHPGIDDGQAAIATELICRELRRAGVAIDGEASGGPAYRVDLHPLGDLVWVTLSYETASGRPVTHRELALSSLDQVDLAAPRLVEALLENRPVADTAEVDTIVGGEARPLDKLPGEFLFGMGLAGMFVPGADVPVAPGLTMGGFYETASFAVGSALRFGVLTSGGDELAYFDWGVGGRYFFTRTSVSPFLGGGLSWLILAADTYESEGGHRELGGSGFALYVEVGVELLRLHQSRLSVDARVGVPLFELEEDYWGWGDEVPADDLYATPVALGLTYSF